jgi:hypothetical protein
MLAPEAIEIGEATDMIEAIGDAMPTSPRCWSSSRKTDEAVTALEQAPALYERQGNVISADRPRARLAELRGSDRVSDLRGAS